MKIRSFSYRRFVVSALLLLAAAAVLFFNYGAGSSAQEPSSIKFAAIGDYGSNDSNELDVANLVKSWNPDFIITLGDNNYPDGEAATIDAAIGKYYHEYIYPYRGSYGSGGSVNKFWPCTGNRDWDNQTGPKLQPYLDYFTLPNNERYYDFVRGPVHFFCIDSDAEEPDGITATSVQANWLKNKLAASNAPWKIVYLHHPPYSSRTSWSNLQWPYKSWGADAVLSGHAHVYERVMKDGIPFITNGLGGDSTGSFDTPISGSVVRFGDDYGALRVTATSTFLGFEFITRRGVVIDTFSMGQGTPTPTPTPTSTPTPTPAPTATPTPIPAPPAAPSSLNAVASSSSQINLSWTDNSNNESSFLLERCSGSGCTNFGQVAQTGSNVTTFANTGLSASTTYRYRVRASNSSGNSSYSNVAEAVTQGSQSVFAAPSNLIATVVSSAQIDLRWTDNSTTEDGFRVYRSTDGVTFSRIATLGPNTTSFSNTGRPASTTYHYKVLAFTSTATSAYSNTVTATTWPAATSVPATPSNLTGTALSSSQIRLNWTDRSANEIGFRVYRSTDGSSFSEIAKLATANITSYVNSSLAAQTSYYYRVRAYNAAGSSNYSSTIKVTTP